MPRKKEDFQFCVYIAGFTNTHKVYVGSTTRWPYRMREHWAGLSLNKHPNQYWQRAYNKYGAEHMYIRELEFTKDEESVRKAEQKWIDFYKSSDPRFGFNLVKEVEQSGTSGLIFTDEQRQKVSEKSIQIQLEKHANLRSEKCELYNPKGELVKIDNLYAFCKENNLHYPSMNDVKNDTRIEYMGWKLDIGRIHRKRVCFCFISPSGEKIEGRGLREFCRKNNLCYRNMCALYRKEIKKTEGGWRRADLTEDQVKTVRGKDHTFISPTGELVLVNNRAAFCRKMGINEDVVRKNCQSLGWKIKND